MNRPKIAGLAAASGALTLIGVCVFGMPASGQATSAHLTEAQLRLAGVWLADAPKPLVKTTEDETPPLKPEAEAVYRERIAARAAGEAASFDPVTWCASPGLPRIMFARHPFELVVSEQRVAVLFEWYDWFRTIDMSGAPQEALFPLKMGASAGRWDGDDLVVTTTDLSDTTLLDRAGLPHSERLTITERLHLTSDDALEIRFTINDPATYTRAWETTMTYSRRPAGSLGEYACLSRIAAGDPPLLED